MNLTLAYNQTNDTYVLKGDTHFIDSTGADKVPFVINKGAITSTVELHYAYYRGKEKYEAIAENDMIPNQAFAWGGEIIVSAHIKVGNAIRVSNPWSYICQNGANGEDFEQSGTPLSQKVNQLESELSTQSSQIANLTKALQELKEQGIDTSTIEQAINNYLQEHPIQGGDNVSNLKLEYANNVLRLMNGSTQLAQVTIASGTNFDLSSYQTKTDNSLKTTQKTIVGAINETLKKALDVSKVQKVEENNKITVKFEAINGGLGTEVEIPLGETGNDWEIIRNISITEEITSLTINTDNNNQSFRLKNANLIVKYPTYTGSGTLAYMFTMLNGNTTGENAPGMYTSLPLPRKDKPMAFLWKIDWDEIFRREQVYADWIKGSNGAYRNNSTNGMFYYIYNDNNPKTNDSCYPITSIGLVGGGGSKIVAYEGTEIILVGKRV